MVQRDEPVIESRVLGKNIKKTPEQTNLKKVIKNLLENSPYGVLATQYKSQPYASLLAYAFTGDLRNIIFVTPQTTRKYKLLNNCKQVAFQVDNRSSNPTNLMSIESLTVTGQAHQIKFGSSDYKKFCKLLIKRHSYLKDFTESPSCSIFSVSVVRYFHVIRFQEVSEWPI